MTIYIALICGINVNGKKQSPEAGAGGKEAAWESVYLSQPGLAYAASIALVVSAQSGKVGEITRSSPSNKVS